MSRPDKATIGPRPITLSPLPILLLLLLPILFTGNLSAQDSAAQNQTHLILPDEGEFLRYQRILGEIDHEDKGPEVSIHVDGTLLVRRPVYQKNPGLWRGRLGAAELQALIDELAASGLFETTDEAMEQHRTRVIQDRAEAARRAGHSPTLHAVGAADRSVMTVHLASYTPPGALNAQPSGPLTRVWAWSDLHGDAGLYPEITELGAFDRLEHLMIQYLDRDTLEEVAP